MYGTFEITTFGRPTRLRCSVVEMNNDKILSIQEVNHDNVNCGGEEALREGAVIDNPRGGGGGSSSQGVNNRVDIVGSVTPERRK